MKHYYQKLCNVPVKILTTTNEKSILPICLSEKLLLCMLKQEASVKRLLITYFKA